MDDQEIRDKYDLLESVELYEDEDDLPGGLEDLTAISYAGSLVHARCPKCGREGGISVFRNDEPTYCSGEGDHDDHMTEWELVGG